AKEDAETQRGFAFFYYKFTNNKKGKALFAPWRLPLRLCVKKPGAKSPASRITPSQLRFSPPQMFSPNFFSSTICIKLFILPLASAIACLHLITV
ncbi:MAG: hypothetical protein WCF67_00335, partial [Chitinophagaceae bacterium]